jgi:hypothetical protein
MFLVPRREGQNGWNSGLPGRLMRLWGGQVRLHLAARLYLSGARRHERSIEEEAPDGQDSIHRCLCNAVDQFRNGSVLL